MIVLVTGGFDPLHVGHVRMIKAARAYGRVVVGVNSDAWLERKKGYVFMPYAERAEVMDGLADVDLVLPIEDADDTVCALLNSLKPNYFANGGDRTEPNIAEHEVCARIGIKELFNVGGGKVQSSSSLVRRRLS